MPERTCRIHYHFLDDIAEKEVGLWYVVSGTLNIRVYVK